MFGKSALLGLVVLCITVLLVLVLSRDRLCTLQLKTGNTEISAKLAYEAR
jgi:protein HokE